MKKAIFLIVLIFVLSSCASSIYYAYEQKGDYCTLEVTKQDDVIYRAFSENYAVPNYDFPNANNIYIYIKSHDENHENSVSIDDFFELYFIKINSDKFNYCGGFEEIGAPYLETLITYSKETKDGLDLLWYPKIKEKLIMQDCTRENAITWFPPYMKRIKKIDYKKFNLPQIEIKHLKNPEKAPKVND